MQPLISLRSAARRAVALLPAIAAGLVAILGASAARADCPWLVHPYEQDRARQQIAYDIVFQGLDPKTHVFYGFTVASLDLAWQLVKQQQLPELEPYARRLQITASERGDIAYRLAEDSIEPHTIYLVAAKTKVAPLEELEARIEPMRPWTVSAQATRGASDVSGPLPHRSMPGVEIAKALSPGAGPRQAQDTRVADMQICAYQVAVY